MIFVDVLNVRQKILLISNSPHPDISALKSSIRSNYDFEVDQFLVKDFNKPLEAYNLVILHQLPASNSASVGLMNKLIKLDVPLLFVIGPQTNINLLNNLDLGLSINRAADNTINEAQGSYNENFTLFSLSEETRFILNDFPPLYTGFGDYLCFPSGEILFYQKIMNIITDYPLFYFNEKDNRKTGFIAGDGLWRWKLENYYQTQDHQAFNEIINKSVRYLSMKVDKRQFKIVFDHQYPENENLIFKAELYNDSYEIVPDNDIELQIENEAGEDFKYQFSSTDNGYKLDAGILPPGKYSLYAKTRLGETVYEDRGEFSILPVVIEKLTTVANHRLLNKLAKANRGTMIYPDEINSIPELLAANENIKPIVYAEKKYTDLINIPWLLGLIILLLATEWFFRKWGGSY